MFKKSLTVVNLLLIAAAVFLCVDVFYAVVEQRLDLVTLAASANTGSRPPTETRDTAGRPAGDADYGMYAKIIERDLFNTAKKPAEEKPMAEPDIENLEKTKLKLKLWGTITGTGEKSYAVIEDTSSREQRLYQKGDTIDQALIKIILRKKVVLTVDGKDEVLEMEEMVDQSHRMAGDERPAGTYEAVSASSTVRVERDEINEAMQNINTLMRQVRIRPYFENGQPSGILLSGIRNNSIFEDMGLQSGDIVKGVNGREIRSVEDALNFYENLKSSSEVELEIQRDGARRTIYYRID